MPGSTVDPRRARTRDRSTTGRSPYEEHRDYVLSVLSGRCRWLNASDREAAFHEAYTVMLEKQRDGTVEPGTMHPRQIRAYLTQTSIHKALDEGKRAERKRTESLDARVMAEPDLSEGPDDLAGASFDAARVREIVSELPERKQTIVKLRFFYDRTPEEIRAYMGISERAYERDLTRALRYLAERYELVREGRFCESRRSLVLAYVAGIAGENRVRDAQVHLATCPGCAHWAAQLREAARSAAAVIPLPAFAVSGPLDRLAELVGAARDQVASVGTTAKEHATAVAARLDGSSAGYATAARPGTVVAAVASCVAIGGGATYCAVEGIPDPVRKFVQQVAPGKERRPPPPRRGSESRASRAEPAQAPPVRATRALPPPPALAAPAARAAQPRPRPAPAAAQPAPSPAPPPAPLPEFDVEPPGAPAQGAVPGAAPGGAAPGVAAPPAGPPGEFDP